MEKSVAHNTLFKVVTRIGNERSIRVTWNLQNSDRRARKLVDVVSLRKPPKSEVFSLLVEINHFCNQFFSNSGEAERLSIPWITIEVPSEDDLFTAAVVIS